LVNSGITTNIHFVLGNNTIDQAIKILNGEKYHHGINSVVFLLYKPVGQGKEENVLKVTDSRVKEFFQIIDKKEHPFKVGFDSCSCSGILNLTNEIDTDSIDFCEGGRFSAYIDSDMNMMPCSFLNQDLTLSLSLNKFTIEEVWNSNVFSSFRKVLQSSCSKCDKRNLCGGGCPFLPSITLCDKKEKSSERIYL